MNDKQIIALFLARDENAVRETSAKYERLCRRIAYDILHNEQDAEECVNTAYEKLWSSIPPKEPELLKGYLCRIVRNTALDMCKAAMRSLSGYREELYELSELSQNAASDTVESMLDSKELGRLINEFLKKQNKVNSNIFVARYFFGMSYDTISDELGIRSNAVRTRLTRIRKELRIFLTERGFDV